jgi:hypothetical protein
MITIALMTLMSLYLYQMPTLSTIHSKVIENLQWYYCDCAESLEGDLRAFVQFPVKPVTCGISLCHCQEVLSFSGHHVECYFDRERDGYVFSSLQFVNCLVSGILLLTTILVHGWIPTTYQPCTSTGSPVTSQAVALHKLEAETHDNYLLLAFISH